MPPYADTGRITVLFRPVKSHYGADDIALVSAVM